MAEQSTQEAVTEIWQLFKETDAKLKETDAKIQETTRQIRALEGLIGSQWGKLIEALVQPNVLRLFQEWGIQVHYVYRRATSQFNGQNMEVDLLLENDEDVIVVEVKSTLKVQDVNDFLDGLKDFLHFFPKYESRHIYGAVAGLSIEEDADRFAYRKGLFVLGVVGDGIVQIKHNKRFRPHNFATDE